MLKEPKRIIAEEPRAPDYSWILERQPLSVKILTELYSRENLTGYAAYERIDGRLIRPEAVQLLSIK